MSTIICRRNQVLREKFKKFNKKKHNFCKIEYIRVANDVIVSPEKKNPRILVGCV